MSWLQIPCQAETRPDARGLVRLARRQLVPRLAFSPAFLSSRRTKRLFPAASSAFYTRNVPA